MDENRKIWDRFWSSRNIIKEITNFFRKYFDRIFANYIKNFIKNKDASIIEIGCGSGICSFNLSKYSNITSLDYSLNALRMTKRGFKKNRSLKKHFLLIGNALKLPFKKNCFDIVFSQGLVEHFEKKCELISEKYRITRKGGYTISLIPNHHPLFRYWYIFTRNKIFNFLYPWEELTPTMPNKVKVQNSNKRELKDFSIVKTEIVPKTFNLILSLITKKN
jgi:ubiquinone/menaquinone biosynthesis C-methylase UbiE